MKDAGRNEGASAFIFGHFNQSYEYFLPYHSATFESAFPSKAINRYTRILRGIIPEMLSAQMIDQTFCTGSAENRFHGVCFEDSQQAPLH